MKQYGRGLPKDQDDLIELARQQDWHISKTASGHPRLVSPRGIIVIASGTPSDTNAVWDFRSRMKRAGLKPGFIKKKTPPPEPKLVVDRSEERKVTSEKVTVPALPAEASVVTAARQRRPAVPLKAALIEFLREHDRPQGYTPTELAPLISTKLKTEVRGSGISSTLQYFAEKDKTFTKVGRGYYRLTEAMSAPKVAATAEEDDEKVLIEFLVQLDKVANIVKRHIDLRKAMADVMQKLGTNK